MNLRTLYHRPAIRERNRPSGNEPPQLRPVEELAPIITWPFAPADTTAASDHLPPTAVEAEVRMKRFHQGNVEEARYTATVSTRDSSPHGIMAALVDAMAHHADLRRARERGDHLIIEVRLRTA